MRDKHLKSKKGFAMIAALLALLILTAVGVIVFTSTTRDIRIAGRVVGEKKAFAAAEAGLHAVMSNAVFSAGMVVNNIQIDALTDPNSIYSYSISNTGSNCIGIKGYDKELWSQEVYQVGITGQNTRYGSRVDVEAGVGLAKSGICAKN